jgi:hypothetical protein
MSQQCNEIVNMPAGSSARQAYEIRKKAALECLAMTDEVMAEAFAKRHGLPGLAELRREDKMRRTVGQGW